MKRKLQSIFLSIGIASAGILAGCQTEAEPAAASAQATLNEPGTTADIEAAVTLKKATSGDLITALPEQERNWMNLTAGQYLEDFDYLYQAMVDNYPYFGVVKRQLNIDISEEYEKTRKEIELCTNDYGFYRTVRNFTDQLEYTGHIFTWNASFYHFSVEGWQDFTREFPEYERQYRPYKESLQNTASVQNYAAMEAFYEPIYKQLDQINGPEEDETDSIIEEIPNVETRVIEENKIAYVNIRMFSMDSYKDDKDILLNFYNQIADYDHLIIDITENGGGGMDYFSDLVVAPNIDRPLNVSVYALAKGGEINRQFFMDEAVATDVWKPVSALPELPNINRDDLSVMDYYSDSPYTVTPSNDTASFHGRIWLLVSGINYSSAEYAAMFSKQSGFATLVGENTGGDGIGIDPAYIVLPNSGLVIQYSPVYGVTQDGTGSEEFGTSPDIYNTAGKTALETCLAVIKAQ